MKIDIANRLNGISEYYFSQKLREIEEMNKAGKAVINLGIGSPDMTPDAAVIETLNTEAAKPNVHAYQSYKGVAALREGMAAWYKKWYGVEVDAATEILPLIGSKEGIMHICMTYLNEGDVALVPNPGYPTYSSAVKLAGGKCVYYNLKAENGWEPDFDSLLQDLTPNPSPGERGERGPGYLTNSPEQWKFVSEYAKENRRNPTESEALLWEELRNRKIDGLKFRRQHPVEGYIPDFVCLDRKLIIEVDGDYHFSDEQQKADAFRKEALLINKYHIVRFTNKEVLEDLPTVVQKIREHLSGELPAGVSNSPLSRRGVGGEVLRPKLMFINYPHMPTGQPASKELFEKLVAFAKQHNILLVHDNPYSFILNDNPMSLLSVNGAKEVTIELNSLSKSHNMAGWRVGMLCGAKERVDEVLRFKSNMDSGMFLPLQLAAAKALTLDESWHNSLNSVYQKRREKVFALLDLLNCTYSKKQVGLFVWAKIPDTYQDGYVVSDDVLHTANVFITPGGIFGSEGDGYIRVSLCSTEENLQKAIERIKTSFNKQ